MQKKNFYINFFLISDFEIERNFVKLSAAQVGTVFDFRMVLGH